MSFMVATPELLTTAAGGLDDIAAALQEATAAAASPTTGIAAAAADEVSALIAQLFGSYGQQFQAIHAQGAAFHAEFAQLLNASAAAYQGTDLANAGRNLALTVNGPSGAAATAPGGAYLQLFTNTTANLKALGAAWSANPSPFLRQILANQGRYAQQAAAEFASAIENLPTTLANLPVTIPVAIEQILSFDAAYFIQDFVATQTGFALTFASALNSGVTGIVMGLPEFVPSVAHAFGTLLTGDYNSAISELADAYRKLLITGYDVSNYSVILTGDLLVPASNPTIIGNAYPTVIGPLDDFFTILNVPAQEAQYLTNLLPPSIPRQMAQNSAKVLSVLTSTNVDAQLVIPVYAPQTAFASITYSLPLIMTYTLAGPPFAALDAFGSSLDSFNQAMATGNAVAAVSTLVDAPANILNGFLNGQVFVDDTILIPTGFPDIVISVPPPPPPFPPFPDIVIPTPKNVAVTPHVPFDGLLVQPHHLTATVDIPDYLIPFLGIPIPGFPFDATIYGTPFMGLAPLLINYVPQQLALAIKPAA